MSRRKLVTIIGARPQFVKASVFSRALLSNPLFDEIIVHTGQHYDREMSSVFFDELKIPRPHFELSVGSGSHGWQTGQMLGECEKVLQEVAPDLLLIYGDTNSTLAGALAAAKLHIPIAHVEAGMRSYNRAMPEEVNRVISDHLSTFLFAPSQVAVANLAREGIIGKNVHNVGDINFDVCQTFGALADQHSEIIKELGLTPHEYFLVTIHRAENTDDAARLSGIASALLQLAREFVVVWPVHPRTKKALEHLGLLTDLQRTIRMVTPMGFLDMAKLEKNSRLIITDSGGVQKEAFYYMVPCVTVRDETEWTELVELQWNTLVDATDPARFVEVVKQSLLKRGISGEPYGRGDTASQILNILWQQFGSRH